MQHDYEESYMTGNVVFVSVSDMLLLRKGNKACLGECNHNYGFSFAFFSLVFFYYFILLLCYVRTNSPLSYLMFNDI